MQPEGRREFVWLVKIERFDYLFDVLAKLFPGITFGHDAFGQTLSAKATVGLLDHFEDEFSHVHNCKLSMSERQVPTLQVAEFPGIEAIAEYIISRISEAQMQENTWETRFEFGGTPI